MIPPAVLSAFPPDVRECAWTLLPSGGGMSGGRVWRGEDSIGPRFALKQWPTSVTPDRMWQIHERMRAVPDDFVPQLQTTVSKNLMVVHAGHCWDIADWKPGTADLMNHSSSAQFLSAGRSLAQIHNRWVRPNPQVSQCAAVTRRLHLLAEWDRTRFQFSGSSDQLRELESTLAVVGLSHATARNELLRVQNFRGPVVAVHGDYWPENVLFQQDQLSAVLDFGNVGFDHPEVDLGRLFADVPAWDRSGIESAVSGYNQLGRYELSPALIELLAVTGRLCSLANWHLRLNVGSPDAGLLSAALPRIRRLVALVTAG